MKAMTRACAAAVFCLCCGLVQAADGYAPVCSQETSDFWADTRTDEVRVIESGDELFPIQYSHTGWGENADAMANTNIAAVGVVSTNAREGVIERLAPVGDEGEFTWEPSTTGLVTFTHTIYTNGTVAGGVNRLVAKFFITPQALRSYTFIVPVDFGEGVTNNVYVTWDWILATLGRDRNDDEDETRRIMYAPDANGINRWQNYVMGVDGTVPSNRFLTVYAKTAESPTKIIVTTRIPADSFANPPEGSGLKPAYGLYDVTAGGAGVQVGENRDVPAFPLDLNGLGYGQTLFKIKATFTAVPPNSVVPQANDNNMEK